jgi:hypothetical protein
MIVGFNNSRILDQATDANGNFIMSNVQAVRNLRPGAMRYVGGTLSRWAHIDRIGYDDKGKTFGGRNSIYPFIEYMKMIGPDIPICLVMNVGDFNTFFWRLDTSASGISRTLDRGKRMIDLILKSGLNVYCVELGNEEYLHVPNGNVFPPTWNYNFLQRLLGQPGRDARFRDEILGYYRMYAEVYSRLSEMIKSEFGLKRAVPMVNNSNFKWIQFNEIISTVDAEYGVFHHYETDSNTFNWSPKIDSFVSAIKAQNRIPIATEINVWFGDQGNEFRSNDSFLKDYQDWVIPYLKKSGVELTLLHRLNGDPSNWSKDSGSTPYDWIL